MLRRFGAALRRRAARRRPVLDERPGPARQPARDGGRVPNGRRTASIGPAETAARHRAPHHRNQRMTLLADNIAAAEKGQGLAGSGLVVIWNGIEDAKRENFMEWHPRQHMVER